MLDKRVRVEESKKSWLHGWFCWWTMRSWFCVAYTFDTCKLSDYSFSISTGCIAANSSANVRWIIELKKKKRAKFQIHMPHRDRVEKLCVWERWLWCHFIPSLWYLSMPDKHTRKSKWVSHYFTNKSNCKSNLNWHKVIKAKSRSRWLNCDITKAKWHAVNAEAR